MVAFFQFPIRIAGNLIYVSYFYVYVIPLVYIFINCRYIQSCSNRNLNIQIFKLIYAWLIFESILWPVMCETYDFSYVTSYWLNMCLWINKYLFLIIIYKKHVSDEYKGFFEYFIGGASLYSIVSLVSLVCKPIRQLMFKFVYISNQDKINYQRAEYKTRFGWTGWSGFNETLVCTFAVVLACILILKNKKDTIKQRRYLVMVIFPLIGNAMFGRIGLLTSIICIFITCCVTFFKGNVKYVLKLLIVISVIIVAFLMLKDKVKTFQTWYSWVFSAFDTYKATGKFYDNMGSVEHLTKDMYWMPEIETFLWGDGRYTESTGAYYMHTDSGVMRPILYYGICNYILSLMGMALLVRTFSDNSYRTNRIVIMLLCVCIGIFEFKGESIWMFVGILFPLVLLKENIGDQLYG